MRRLFILFLLITFFNFNGRSQFEVETGVRSIDEYVNEVLIGVGVKATKVRFNGRVNGFPVQIGTFSGGTRLGMERGLILSTEHVTNSSYENLGNAYLDDILIPDNEIVNGNPDLLSVANLVPQLLGADFNVRAIKDQAILEFDFVPTGDTLRFSYVFASDEWTRYINSSFNDVFAFFLSGPGISGPYSSPPEFPGGSVNLAVIPGSNPALPISVSSVHAGNPNGSDCVNCGYFNYNVPQADIAVNGFTNRIEVKVKVNCGETYHIRLAIADGTERDYESIVLLEEGSFSSASIVDIAFEKDIPGKKNLLYEDCGQGSFTFTRSKDSNISLPETVQIAYSGTAQNGVDYELLPETVVIPANEQSVTYAVIPLADGTSEGEEMAQLDVRHVSACAGGGVKTVHNFYIKDSADPIVFSLSPASICPGDSLLVAPFIRGGYGAYTYDWSTGDTTASVVISPPDDEVFGLTVSDICGAVSVSKSFVCTVYDPIAISFVEDGIYLSCGESAIVNARVSGGDQKYSYLWTDDNGIERGTTRSLPVESYWNTDSLYLKVTDGCGQITKKSISLSVDVDPLSALLLGPDSVNCGEMFVLTTQIQDAGSGKYYYRWTVNGVNYPLKEPSISLQLNKNTRVCCYITDDCLQKVESCLDVKVVYEASYAPLVVNMGPDITMSCVEEADIIPQISGGSNYFEYLWSSDSRPRISTERDLLGYKTQNDVFLYYSVKDFCWSARASGQIWVRIENPPLIIEAGPDLRSSCLTENELTVSISSGSPEFNYRWLIDGNVVGYEDTLRWQSNFSVNVQVEVSDACGLESRDEVYIRIPDLPLYMETSPDTIICLGGTAELWAFALGGEGGIKYRWPGLSSEQQKVSVSPEGKTAYVVVASDICGKEISDTIVVDVSSVSADFTFEKINARDVKFESFLEPDSCSNCSFYWNFGDATYGYERHPLHHYSGVDAYISSLFYENSYGCKDSVSAQIAFPALLYAPNAFTPNGDGLNDQYKVEVYMELNYEIFIYNRWGLMVYKSTDHKAAWDGRDMKTGDLVHPGTYVYIIRVKGLDSDVIEKTGHIEVLR